MDPATRKKNNEFLETGMLTYPSWQIVAGKWVRVAFQPASGNTWIILEQYPNKYGFFTGLRLLPEQWDQLKMTVDTILEYVEASETGKSWIQLAQKWNHCLEQVEPFTHNGSTHNLQVKFKVSDSSIYTTITSLDPWNKGGCHVDLRECYMRNDGTLIHNLKGITLVGGGFHFLAKRLWSKVDAAILMWKDMFFAGRGYLQMCLSNDSSDEQLILKEDKDDDDHDDEPISLYRHNLSPLNFQRPTGGIDEPDSV